MPRRARRLTTTFAFAVTTTTARPPAVAAVPLGRVSKQPPAAPRQHTLPRGTCPPPLAVVVMVMVRMVVVVVVVTPPGAAPLAPLVVEAPVSVLSRLCLCLCLRDNGGWSPADQAGISECRWGAWPWPGPVWSSSSSPRGVVEVVDGAIVAGGGGER